VSNGAILAYNVDTFSITLGAGQSILVGNFGSLSASISGYPSGTVYVNDVSVVVNVSDPDGVFNYSVAQLFSGNYVLLDSKVNYSLNSGFSFENISSGDKFLRIVIYGNDSSTTVSNFFPFTVFYAEGSSCSAEESSLVSYIMVLFLIVIILFIATVYTKAGGNPMIWVYATVSIIILIIAIPIIKNIIGGVC
jgi:hypothetical protein